jgi:hypothetical protein
LFEDERTIHHLRMKMVFFSTETTYFRSEVIRKEFTFEKNACFLFIRLSHLLSDDWKKDKKQEWQSSDFGDCAKLRFKVKKNLILVALSL